MGPEATWQNTSCNLCMTYLLASINFSGTIHDIHCDPVSAVPDHSFWSSLRDLENSVGRGPNICGCCRSCHWPNTRQSNNPNIRGWLTQSSLGRWPGGRASSPSHKQIALARQLSWDQAARSERSEKQYYHSKSRESFFWKERTPAPLRTLSWSWKGPCSINLRVSATGLAHA